MEQRSSISCHSSDPSLHNRSDSQSYTVVPPLRQIRTFYHGSTEFLGARSDKHPRYQAKATVGQTDHQSFRPVLAQRHGTPVPLEFGSLSPQDFSMHQTLPHISMPKTLLAKPIRTHSQQYALPSPKSVLPSQTAHRPKCLACGKQKCHLISHKHFTRQALGMDKELTDIEAQSESTPRPTNALPVRSVGASEHELQVHTALVSHAEQDHLLGLWSIEWSPIRRGPEKHLFPTKFIDRILPTARNCAPLLQALLAYSGSLWAMANDVVSDLAARQQAVAVEMLSQACPSEQEAKTDEAMLAATMLLLVYMAQGNGDEVGKHIAGLVHLVKLRGGLYYLGLSGLLAEILTYADHMQAILYNHEPVWQLTLPPLDIGVPIRKGGGFNKRLEFRELDPRLASAALSVSRVADIFEHATSTLPLPSSARHTSGYLSMMAEYQLACCNAAFHGSSTVSECICLALILFDQVVLCSNGAVTPGTRQVEFRFWQVLEVRHGIGSTLGLYPCLYVWMVFMGLTVSIRAECQYRALGIERLKAAKNIAGINTWDQLRHTALDDFVWLASAQEDTFRRIWMEVEGEARM